MGYLLPILLSLGSLVLDEFDGLPMRHWPLGVLALVSLPYLLAALEQQAAMRGSLRRAAWFSRLGQLAPVVLQYAAVGIFGWRASLEEWFQADLSVLIWPEPGMLLVLAPFLFYTLAAIDAEARIASPGPERRSQLRSFQLRMLCAGLGPVVGYILLATLVGRWEVLRILIEQVSLWSLAFTLALGFTFVLALPRFLRATWETEPLPVGPQRELLEGVARLAGFRCRELLVWKTGNLMSNAAIVGLLARGRRVFFTDELLRRMGPRQLAAVFAHEIGHARRHHVPIFIVWALAFFSVLDALLAWIAFDDQLLELSVLAGALVAWLLGFGWISRRAELEADLFCLELLSDGTGIKSALQSAAPASHSRTGWRHFSTRQRIEFLDRAAEDPAVGTRLRRQVRVTAVAGALLLAITGTWRLAQLVGDYPVERTLVDLRQGHYAQAQERLWSWESEEESEQARALAELVRLTGSGALGDFDRREAAAARCAELAATGLTSGELDRALGWLRLGGLAGDEVAGRAAEALAGVAEGVDFGPLPGVDLGPWTEALTRALTDP
jgi:Zn-dependent protease with chaperone function